MQHSTKIEHASEKKSLSYENGKNQNELNFHVMAGMYQTGTLVTYQF